MSYNLANLVRTLWAKILKVGIATVGYCRMPTFKIFAHKVLTKLARL